MASLQPALAALVAQVLETDDVKPQQLLDLVVQQMLDPSDRRVAQHRPSQVVCRDKAHAVALTTSLAAIGVRCGVLTEPPGMPGYISIVSKQLVKAGQAADGAAADRPGRSPCAWCWCGDHAHRSVVQAGLLSGDGVTEALATEVVAAAAQIYARRPWTRLSERQLLRCAVRSAVPCCDQTLTGDAGLAQGASG